jgi:hypothetical protein
VNGFAGTAGGNPGKNVFGIPVLADRAEPMHRFDITPGQVKLVRLKAAAGTFLI